MKKKQYIPPFLYARMLGKPLVLQQSQEKPYEPPTNPTFVDSDDNAAGSKGTIQWHGDY